MSHALLTNAMRLQALRARSARFETRLGTVQNYDPTNYCVKVELLPDQILTGNIPLAALWVGNHWGLYCPPSLGDLVAVTFFDGSLDTGYAELRFFNNVDRPLSVQSGEFWLVHAKGQFVKLTNDGKLTLSDGQGATITFNGDGTLTSSASAWTHTGPITVDGEVTANDIPLSQHLHPVVNIQTGGSTVNSNAPIA